MSKYFYMILLIEYIKINGNLNYIFYNNSNITFPIYPIEINTTFNDSHIGIELNLSSFDYIEQEYLYFYHNIDILPKITNFRLLFASISENISINHDNFDIKCIYDINNNISNINDINNLNNISLNESNCIGKFDKYNENKYDGILNNNINNINNLSSYNDSNLEKKTIIYAIKYEWNNLSEIKIYIRTNIHELPYKEGIISEKEDYTSIPYFINLKKFNNITDELILYSPINNLHLYYLNNDFSQNIPSLLFKGNIIMLYTNKNIIKLKYNNIEEMILFITPIENNTANNISNNYFEIKFNLINNSIINYYYMDKFPYNKQISLQMIEQNKNYCVIINSQNEDINNDATSKLLYSELIYGNMGSLKIYDNFNYSTWGELMKNGQNLNVNESYHIINNNNDIYMICAKNNDIPSMIHFYFTNIKQNKSYSKELSLGETFLTNIQTGNKLNINIIGFNNNSEFDISVHIFNNENIINTEMNIDNDLIKIFEKNTIEGFKIKTNNESMKQITIYNKGDYNCSIIIKTGLQINETEDKIEDNIYYNSKYNLYYYIFPKLIEEYKYSKIYINIEPNNSTYYENYLLNDNFNGIINPSFDNFYLDINHINNISNNSYFELLNPYIIYNKDFYDKNNLNYYLIIKPKEKNENLKIIINFEKYDFFNETELNNFFILKIPEKYKTGIIILSENRKESYIQMVSCENDKFINFQIYDTFYKNNYLFDVLSTNQFKYYTLKENYFDLCISFTEKNGNNSNIFINHFEYSKALNESMNQTFLVEFNNITNSIHLIKPFNSFFNYTILLDMKGALVDKNITICNIISSSDLNKLAYYIKNISDEDFVDNEYKLNFTSDILKNYKSFDMLIYAKEYPVGMHFLSKIISIKEEKKAINISNIYQKNNEKILYYIGKMESINYYKIDMKGNYETLITMHFDDNFEIDKIYIDCAQLESNLVKDIKIVMMEQKNKEICKIIDIKNDNNKIINIFVKMQKNLYNSLAIRILNDIEDCKIGIYVDIDNLNLKKEIIVHEEEENKIIELNHPFCFKYYKIFLDDVNNDKYAQIGLYSPVQNSISLLINDDNNEKILIDYGNFIIINTNENYIINNYNYNKELIVIIGDYHKQILNENDKDIKPMKLNIIGLTKKYSSENANKINIIKYYSYNDITNINDIFVPLYINKCNNTLNNYIVLNIKVNSNRNINFKKYIKINLDFGDISLIEYSNILNKESFNDIINNLSPINLKEKNLILFENNIYIFKIICTNYMFMNIYGYEIDEKQIKHNYILECGSILDIPLNFQEKVNLDLTEVINSTLIKIDLSNEIINFDIDIEIDQNELMKMNTTNRILLLDLEKKAINNIKVKGKHGTGYIQIIVNINKEELINEENNDYLSYNNRELYIYPHKIDPNNDLIKVSIPILNKEKSKYILVCYYLSQIIYINKKIPNCLFIYENTLENITVRNPYNIYGNKNISNISNIYIMFYKNGENKNKKLELKEVIIEEEGKNDNNQNNNENVNDNSSIKVGKAVLIIVIIIIVLFVIYFVFIYIRKLNRKKKELYYQATINNENELLVHGINNPLMGRSLSLNDEE